MREQLGNPAGIRLVGPVSGAPPHLLRIADEHLDRAHQDMVDRAPIDSSALHRDDRALLLGEPGAQGEQGLVGGGKLADVFGHLSIRVDAAQTGGQLRLMDVDPATGRMHHLHSTFLLGSHRAWSTGGHQGFRRKLRTSHA
jgi:hypothetical protein